MRLFKFQELLLWGVLIAWTVLLVWPLSFWYDAGEVYVPNILEGEQLTLIYDGVVKRDVDIKYQVITREVDTGLIIDESSSNTFRYRAGTERPHPITIEWWAPESFKSHKLPPGNYTITTCWTATTLFFGLIPQKTSCSKSNIFTVYNKNKLEETFGSRVRQQQMQQQIPEVFEINP